MLPSTPPAVSMYGAYSIEETCVLLGCCRDTLRKKTEQGKIRNNYLDEENENTVYYAVEILRYWFNTTKQPKSEAELQNLLKELQSRGYEATFGCKPPVVTTRRNRKQKKQSADVA